MSAEDRNTTRNNHNDSLALFNERKRQKCSKNLRKLANLFSMSQVILRKNPIKKQQQPVTRAKSDLTE